MDGSGPRPASWLLLREMRLWLPDAVRIDIEREASSKYPLETGGVLLGYWNEHEVVVTSASGPGPNAQHRRMRFKPDHDFQQSWIDRHYRRSKGIETYLGDWHTHPDARIATPSWMDRATVRRVARSEYARAPRPLMMILAGSPEAWAEDAWVGHLEAWLGTLKRCKLELMMVCRHAV